MKTAGSVVEVAKNEAAIPIKVGPNLSVADRMRGSPESPWANTCPLVDDTQM